MNIPCPNVSPCIDPATPVTNYSTEAPDPNTFISLQWPFTNPDNPVGGGPCQNCPPPVWNADGCQSECSSTVSQQAADLCAAAQAALCVAGPGNRVFFNSRQECDTICPDGAPFAYFVAAGLFVGTTQAAADAQAAAFACKAVQKFVFCLSDIAKEVCVGSGYDSTITVSQGNAPFTFAQVGGSLPPGLALSVTSNRTLRLSGTPTTGGSYNFVIKAMDSFGNFMQKPYTVCVVDITPAQLPDCTIGVAYNAQLTATACANQTQSWQVISGSLPPGLTINEATGVISGTPTGPAGSVLFRVRFQDQSS